MSSCLPLSLSLSLSLHFYDAFVDRRQFVRPTNIRLSNLWEQRVFRKHDQNSSGGKFALQLRLPSGISRKSPRFLLLEEAEVGKIHLRGGVGGVGREGNLMQLLNALRCCQGSRECRECGIWIFYIEFNFIGKITREREITRNVINQ